MMDKYLNKGAAISGIVTALIAVVSTVATVSVTATTWTHNLNAKLSEFETDLAETRQREVRLEEQLQATAIRVASIQAGLSETQALIGTLQTDSGIVGPQGPAGPPGPAGPAGPSANNETTVAMLNQLSDRLSGLEATVAGLPQASSEISIQTLRSQRSASIEALSGTNSATTLDGMLWEFKDCRRVDRNIECSFSVTNTTVTDAEACIGSNNRVVTDTGLIEDDFGLVIGTERAWTELCASVPATATINGNMYRSFGTRDEVRQIDELSILRLDCGRGCLIELYDIPL